MVAFVASDHVIVTKVANRFRVLLELFTVTDYILTPLHKYILYFQIR
jgi:hypothetical protein